MTMSRLGVRWTIGDVSPAGFEALRLSIWGAWRLFGGGADVAYAVCVNSVPVERARALAGALPPGVTWIPVERAIPPWLAPHLDRGMAEGVAWKLLPLQVFPDRHELSLDNDCILWDLPPAIKAWRAAQDACLLAEDVRACFGRFAPLCGAAPRNSGIRGLPPGFDLARRLKELLGRSPGPLTSELDEQGLQVAALSADRPPLVVRTVEVTICSPFPPHEPHLGRAGAHFVGLNARSLGWSFEGRPAEERRLAHWRALVPEVCARVGAAI